MDFDRALSLQRYLEKQQQEQINARNQPPKLQLNQNRQFSNGYNADSSAKNIWFQKKEPQLIMSSPSMTQSSDQDDSDESDSSRGGSGYHSIHDYSKSGSIKKKHRKKAAGHYTCAVCGEKTMAMCSSCRKVFYCSVQHQQAHWKYHKEACYREQLARLESLEISVSSNANAIDQDLVKEVLRDPSPESVRDHTEDKDESFGSPKGRSVGTLQMLTNNQPGNMSHSYETMQMLRQSFLRAILLHVSHNQFNQAMLKCKTLVLISDKMYEQHVKTDAREVIADYLLYIRILMKLQRNEEAYNLLKFIKEFTITNVSIQKIEYKGTVANTTTFMTTQNSVINTVTSRYLTCSQSKRETKQVEVEKTDEYLNFVRDGTASEDQKKQILADITKVAEIYSTEANFFWELGDAKNAEDLYVKYVVLFENNFGMKSLELSNCLYLMGVFYLQNWRFEKAVACFRRALAIRVERLGTEMHEGVADIHYNLGVLYKRVDDYYESMEHFEKALEIRSSLIGEVSLGVAQIYEQMGKLFYSKSDFRAAYAKFLTCYNFRKKILTNSKHPEILRVLKLANLLRKKICRKFDDPEVSLSHKIEYFSIVKEICALFNQKISKQDEVLLMQQFRAMAAQKEEADENKNVDKSGTAAKAPSKIEKFVQKTKDRQLQRDSTVLVQGVIKDASRSLKKEKNDTDAWMGGNKEREETPRYAYGMLEIEDNSDSGDDSGTESEGGDGESGLGLAKYGLTVPKSLDTSLDDATENIIDVLDRDIKQLRQEQLIKAGVIAAALNRQESFSASLTRPRGSTLMSVISDKAGDASPMRGSSAPKKDEEKPKVGPSLLILLAPGQTMKWAAVQKKLKNATDILDIKDIVFGSEFYRSLNEDQKAVFLADNQRLAQLASKEKDTKNQAQIARPSLLTLQNPSFSDKKTEIKRLSTTLDSSNDTKRVGIWVPLDIRKEASSQFSLIYHDDTQKYAENKRGKSLNHGAGNNFARASSETNTESDSGDDPSDMKRTRIAASFKRAQSVVPGANPNGGLTPESDDSTRHQSIMKTGSAFAKFLQEDERTSTLGSQNSVEDESSSQLQSSKSDVAQANNGSEQLKLTELRTKSVDYSSASDRQERGRRYSVLHVIQEDHQQEDEKGEDESHAAGKRSNRGLGRSTPTNIHRGSPIGAENNDASFEGNISAITLERPEDNGQGNQQPKLPVPKLNLDQLNIGTTARDSLLDTKIADSNQVLQNNEVKPNETSGHQLQPNDIKKEELPKDASGNPEVTKKENDPTTKNPGIEQRYDTFGPSELKTSQKVEEEKITDKKVSDTSETNSIANERHKRETFGGKLESTIQNLNPETTIDSKATAPQTNATSNEPTDSAKTESVGGPQQSLSGNTNPEKTTDSKEAAPQTNTTSNEPVDSVKTGPVEEKTIDSKAAVPQTGTTNPQADVTSNEPTGSVKTESTGGEQQQSTSQNPNPEKTIDSKAEVPQTNTTNPQTNVTSNEPNGNAKTESVGGPQQSAPENTNPNPEKIIDSKAVVSEPNKTTAGDPQPSTSNVQAAQESTTSKVVEETKTNATTSQPETNNAPKDENTSKDANKSQTEPETKKPEGEQNTGNSPEPAKISAAEAQKKISELTRKLGKNIVIKGIKK